MTEQITVTALQWIAKVDQNVNKVKQLVNVYRSTAFAFSLFLFFHFIICICPHFHFILYSNNQKQLSSPTQHLFLVSGALPHWSYFVIKFHCIQSCDFKNKNKKSDRSSRRSSNEINLMSSNKVLTKFTFMICTNEWQQQQTKRQIQNWQLMYVITDNKWIFGVYVGSMMRKWWKWWQDENLNWTISLFFFSPF